MRNKNQASKHTETRSDIVELAIWVTAKVEMTLTCVVAGAPHQRVRRNLLEHHQPQSDRLPSARLPRAARQSGDSEQEGTQREQAARAGRVRRVARSYCLLNLTRVRFVRRDTRLTLTPVAVHWVHDCVTMHDVTCANFTLIQNLTKAA